MRSVEVSMRKYIDSNTVSMKITQDTITSMVKWIRSIVKGVQGITIEVDGSINSRIALVLCAEAVGTEYVHPLILPRGMEEYIQASEKFCKTIGVNPQIINIGDLSNQLFELDYFFSEAKKSMLTGLRNTIVHSYAKQYGNKVCNTIDACDRFIGKHTERFENYGDFSLFGNLTSNQVKEVGKLLGIFSEDFLQGKERNEVSFYDTVEKCMKKSIYDEMLLEDGLLEIEEMNKKAFDKLKPVPSYKLLWTAEEN